ncbi:MAG: transposase, partial [Crocinitomicaceae bacterium]|nr:transposase [Crocinitomicaceae bacterium]
MVGVFAFRCPHQKKLCVFQPGRSEEHHSKMLKGYKGIIQTDGYAGYNKAAGSPDVNQIYCMAHARRYFERALDNDPDRAKYFL